MGVIMQFIQPTQHEKNEWARMANAAYKAYKSDIGHRYSSFSALPGDATIRIDVFDTLQRNYRNWLISNQF
jgi:hypothetical protein